MPTRLYLNWTERAEACQFVRRFGEVFRTVRTAIGSQYMLSPQVGQTQISRIELAERAVSFNSLLEVTKEAKIPLASLFVKTTISKRRIDAPLQLKLEQLYSLLGELTDFSPTDFRISLGTVIRSLREGEGCRNAAGAKISLRGLAAAAQIDHTFLSRLERGRTWVSVPILYDIARALGTNIGLVVALAVLECFEAHQTAAARQLLSETLQRL